MDSLFLRQVWAGNDALLQQLSRDVVTRPAGPERTAAEARLHYFLVNKGPWSRLDHNKPFVPGVPAKPEAANFYPAGATKDQVQKWLDGLSGDAKASATGFFTTIRKGPQGFTAVPYSIEYQGELADAATHLREAANATTEPTLKKFLTARADAFVSNDYYASDVAWMELDAAVEPTIGPYEVYEDEWFNAKAAFEAFITVRDDAESKKLQSFSSHLQELENALPIDPKYRNGKLGAMAPIRVVNVVFAAGDGNRGVQTAAYNLPNDERVVREKGTKRVMLKNMQDAKFNKVLLPIAKVALPVAQQKDVSFDAFFTHILMHELMHGLGPHNISVGGRATTVRQELKETYSAIEEAKADVSGLWALKQLADNKQIDAGDRADDVHHVPGVIFPIDSIRRQRGARARYRRAAELVPRRRRVQGAARRHLQRGQREDRRCRHGADARDHDAPGRGQLREGESDDREARRRQAGSAEGARPPDRRAGGHRAEVHDRRDARALTTADSDIGPVADDPVDAPVEEPRHVRFLVHGPDLHGEADSVRVLDEPPGDDRRRARSFGDLELLVAGPAKRPAHPRSIERPPRLFARGARAQCRARAAAPPAAPVR